MSYAQIPGTLSCCGAWCPDRNSPHYKEWSASFKRIADLSCQSYREQRFAQWPGHAPAEHASLPASRWTYSRACGEVIGTPKTCPQRQVPGHTPRVVLCLPEIRQGPIWDCARITLELYRRRASTEE